MADENPKAEEPVKPEPQAPEAKPEASPKKSKWPLVVIGLLLLLLIPLGGYFLFTQFGPKSAELTPTPTPTPIETAKETPTPGQNEEFAFDETYTSSEHGWQIDYSSDLKVTKYGPEQIGKSGVGEVVNFSFVGPTQAEGTEFYDGISITIGVKERAEGQTLSDFVDKDTEVDPEVGSKTPLKAIEINGLSGFETTVSGLGKIRNIYLQHPKNKNQAYYIGIFVEGPGESGKKYQEIVDKMLEGFRNIQ